MNMKEFIEFMKKNAEKGNNLQGVCYLYKKSLDEYALHHISVCEYADKVVSGEILTEEESKILCEEMKIMNLSCKFLRKYKSMLLKSNVDDTLPANFWEQENLSSLCKDGTNARLVEGTCLEGAENFDFQKMKTLESRVTPKTIELLEYVVYVKLLLGRCA